MLKKEQNLHEKALKRFKACQEYWDDQYARGHDDLCFLLGEQWPEDIRESRRKEKRPCLTENRLLAYFHQVHNDIRQSRPAINVSPVDDGADVETARVLKGIIRNIEMVSNADTVYDTGSRQAISTGFGWIRLGVDFTNPKDFDREISITQIKNPRSVYLDPSIKEYDGSDAEFAFVFEDIPEDEFESQYPDADMDSFLIDDQWVQEDTIRVAEYFYKSYKTKTIVQLADFTVMEEADAKEQGLEWVNKRTVKVPTVNWCKITQKEILETQEWEGSYIPIVPVFGEEFFNEGKRQFYSLIHQAKDPQRMFNYWITSSTEVVALQPKSPYIGIEGQFDGHEAKWTMANVRNMPYLEYKPVMLPDGTTIAQAPQRQPPPQGSSVMFQEALRSSDGIKATLGIFDASIGNRSNETSGRAILARQAEGDNATFHFVDNLAKSIRQVGRIIVDLVPKIYSDKKIARVLGEDATSEMIPLGEVYQKDGKTYKIDLAAGQYDVSVSMGASYATKRQEAVTAMLEMARAAPQILPYIIDIMAKNMDWVGADIIAERAHKLLPPELKEQTQEGQQLQQAGQALEAMGMQLQQMEAALKAKEENSQFDKAMQIEKLKAEKEMDEAKIELEKQKLALESLKVQYQIGVPSSEIQQVIMAIQGMQSQMDDVSGAVSAILDAAEESGSLSESNQPNMVENNLEGVYND